MKKKQAPKPKYNKLKFLATFGVAVLLFAAIRHLADIRVPMLALDRQTEQNMTEGITEVYIGTAEDDFEEVNPLDTVQMPDEIFAEEQDEEKSMFADEEDPKIQADTEEAVVDESTDNTDNSAEQSNSDAQTDKGFAPHKIKGVHSWTEAFPDINDVQLVAAQKNGIKPAKNRDIAQRYVREHKLVDITNSPFYTVDDLTHSMPYLVPKAQHLLNTICMNFIDSLYYKGIPPHLPMVTSVLRTTEDVSRLQRGNKNATTNSCHCYGTTVDISYNRFVPVTGEYDPNAPLLRWDFKMKQILAEVLSDLRQQGKCYVKYEYKQSCFHLTVR